MVEVWREDAVYTFGFGEAVDAAQTMTFEARGSTVAVSYMRSGGVDQPSPRACVEAFPRGGVQGHAVGSADVLPVPGLEDGWTCEATFVPGDVVREVLSWRTADQTVVTLERTSADPASVQAGAGMLASLVQRIGERVGGQAAQEGEAVYMFGPLQLRVPVDWVPGPEFAATLLGGRPRRIRVHHVRLEFSGGAPKENWFATPECLKGEHTTLVSSPRWRHASYGRKARARCWAAVPVKDGPDAAGFVATVAVCILEWEGRGACRIEAAQQIPSDAFQPERDLDELRSLVMWAGLHCERKARVNPPHRPNLLEIWQRDAVYTVEFGPEVTLHQPQSFRFDADGGSVDASYSCPGHHRHVSPREVVDELHVRIMRLRFAEMSAVSTGVLPIEDESGQAWHCEVEMLGGELAGECVGRRLEPGIVLGVSRDANDRAAAEAGRGALQPFALRVQPRGTAMPARADEVLYVLGPLEMLAPARWQPRSRVTAQLVGSLPGVETYFDVDLEFFEGAAPAEWFETPHYVENYLCDDDYTLARSAQVRTQLEGRTVVATSWAAVPPPDPDGDPPNFRVETTAVAVIEWGGRHACRIRAHPSIAYEDFERERDLARLRDLVGQAATSCCRDVRVGIPPAVPRELTTPAAVVKSRPSLARDDGPPEHPRIPMGVSFGDLDPLTTVRGVQARLKHLGYYRGAVDGESGPCTHEALLAFQKDNGLPVTAELDAQTRALLGERSGI